MSGGPGTQKRAAISLLWTTALLVLSGALALYLPRVAYAQAAAQVQTVNRNVSFAWDESHQSLSASFDFQDSIDEDVTRRLKLGLPARILLTALVYRRGSTVPAATTFQSCKVTWHVWEEMYRIELFHPDAVNGTSHWTPTLAGVLRRCATATKLAVATAAQVGTSPLFLDVTVRINPLGEELLAKLKRWINDTPRNGAADPSSALFSTFTGLFLQRLGDAEKTLQFRTIEASPK